MTSVLFLHSSDKGVALKIRQSILEDLGLSHKLETRNILITERRRTVHYGTIESAEFESLNGPREMALDEQTIQNERLALVHDLIASLPNRERTVMEAIKNGASMRATSLKLDLPYERVKVINKNFVLKARKLLCTRRRSYVM